MTEIAVIAALILIAGIVARPRISSSRRDSATALLAEMDARDRTTPQPFDFANASPAEREAYRVYVDMQIAALIEQRDAMTVESDRQIAALQLEQDKARV